MDFGKDWDKRDTGLLLTFLAGVNEDINSTKGKEETNPFLSRKPSDQELDRAGIVAGLLGAGGAALLPTEWRKPALGALAGLEHGLAYKNRNVDVKKGASFAESRLEGPLMMAALGGLLGHMMGKEGVNISLDGGKDSKSALGGLRVKLSRDF